MNQAMYDDVIEYYSETIDDDFEPAVPMPLDPPVEFDEEQYPFDPDQYLPNGELDQ